jgi:OFA family oxalate/formate antiporter-like MFS transporter
MGAITENRQGLKVLIAGSVLQLFMGIIYVWSVFKAPVSKYYGWAPPDVGLVVSFMLCFFVIGILAGGRAQVKIGTRLASLIGGLMVAAGMLATALIPAAADGAARAPVFMIYLFYGIIGGFGVGAAYNAALSTAQKWFPENRGFATGVSVCAFGFSTVVFAPLADMLNKRFSGGPIAIGPCIEANVTFLILSGIFAAAVLATFWFIKTPEQVGGAAAPALKGKQYATLEMIKTPRYFIITLSMMFGTAGFFIINPDLKDLANDRGAASFATGLVMLTGIANALGRLGVPLLSDKIGREYAAVTILSGTAIGVLGLCFAQGFLLISIIAVVSFCYGGYSGLYPVITSENFGLKNIGSNYGAVMVGFMLSALFFPMIANKIGDQAMKFAALGGVGIAGAALAVVLKIMNAKKSAEIG